MKFSLCMIVRDEEDVLERCLSSAAGLFDEIVIVDTGSKDRTCEIARQFTDKVYDFEWVDDFAAARNFAFSKASGDYLMWLDADDVIEGENYRLFEELFRDIERTHPDVVMLAYNVAFEGERVTLSYERERVLRAEAGFWFEGAVHEAVPPRGKVIHGSAAVSHRKMGVRSSTRNLGIFEKMLANGRTFSARECYYYARELRWAGRSNEAVEWYQKCADDEQAWLENRVSAAFEMSTLLWETGERELSDEALMKCLMMAEPRADVCCEIGRRHLERRQLGAAKFWYELAPRQFLKPLGGFLHADFGGYIPYLQLCVIYDRLGETKLAAEYNELAGKVKPDSKAVSQNREYFAGKGISQTTP